MAKFIPYTFTKKDVISDFKNDKQYENWIAGQVRSKKIVKVRNGLYVHVDVSGYPLTTKFELATKIAEDAFVCYHSAFEYFGVANQVFNTVTVGSKKRFNDFTFDDIDYVRKPLKHDVQIMNIVTAAVRVTSLERTVIDCLDDIDAGGGIDEILNALDQIRVLDETKLLETLKAYDSVFLYQKAGYVLEHFQDKFMLTDSFFEECKSKLTKLAWALEGYGGGDVTAICERIKLEPYKREVSTGEPQKITRDDCNKILTNTRNVITQEELDKFTAYRNGTYNGD